jgi:hypothetical protein
MKKIPGELRDSDRVSVDELLTERRALRRSTCDLLQENAQLRDAGLRAAQIIIDERRDHHVTNLIAAAQRNRIRALRTALETYLLLLASVAAVTLVYALDARTFDASGGFLFFKTRPRTPAPIEQNQ